MTKKSKAELRNSSDFESYPRSEKAKPKLYPENRAFKYKKMPKMLLQFYLVVAWAAVETRENT